MLKPAVFASVLAASAVIAMVGPAAAAGPAPNPPPGSANVQTGGVSSDGQGNPTAYHCGADASTGSGTVAVPPTQVGASGASTPSGCSSPSSGTAPSGAGGQTAPTGAGAGSGTGKTGTANAATTGTSQAAGSDVVPLTLSRGGSGSSGGALWLGLLLLLGLLFALVGFAVGRRRPARASA